MTPTKPQSELKHNENNNLKIQQSKKQKAVLKQKSNTRTVKHKATEQQPILPFLYVLTSSG